MTRNLLRLWAALAALVPAAIVCLADPPRNPPEEQVSANARGRFARDVPPFSHALYLPTDPGLPRKLEAAQDLIKDKDWPKATHFLQSLLDNPEDAFLPLRHRDADDKESITWTTARAEATRLLGTLPREGLEFYEVAYGSQARALLAAADAGRDPETLAAAARRFPLTKAGAEALNRLGTYHLDRGRPAAAALCFEGLLGRTAVNRVPPLTLFKAYQALVRTGDRPAAEQVWERLADAAPDGLRLGDRRVGLDLLRQAATRGSDVPAEESSAGGWTAFRGGPGRGNRAEPAAPMPEARWQQPTLAESTTHAWLQDALQYLDNHSQPVLPALFPITAGGLLICRSQRGVSAIDLHTGKLAWDADSPWALDSLALESEHRVHIDAWLGAYLQREGRPEILLENSVLGTLSTDGARVYAVEDLPVPPFPPSGYAAFAARAGQGLRLPFAPEISDAVNHNSLLAIDVQTGKVAWEVHAVRPAEGGQTPAGDTYFLGPPLPLHGKLYVLAETDQALRLVCLDPAAGALLWTQTLAYVRNRLLLDGGRRIHATPLTYAEGILICPTNAGAVFAVDPLSHHLLWAHAYHEEPPPPPIEMLPRGRFRPGARPMLPQAPPNLTADWKLSAPVIAEGKVVFTAPDEPSVHCLRLRDGTPLWKVPRNSRDLYLAGTAARRALIVGREECRALDLADGKEAWSCETGMPSGQGVFTGTVYYLPIKAAAASKEPEVCVLDVAQGAIREHLPASPGDVPGNLLFHEGQVFSQTLTAVTATPAAVSKQVGPK